MKQEEIVAINKKLGKAEHVNKELAEQEAQQRTRRRLLQEQVHHLESQLDEVKSREATVRQELQEDTSDDVYDICSSLALWLRLMDGCACHGR